MLGKHASEAITATVDGEIAETAMWNEILTAEQIAGLRDGIMPDPAHLLWWPMSEGAGPSAADAGPGALHGTLQNGAEWSGTCPWADADLDGTVAYEDPDDFDPSVP